jgi:hypothetical protein
MRLMILLAVLVAACQPDGRGPGIDVDRALGHVNTLVEIGPRPAGSEAAGKAASYIEAELGKLGATVERLPVGTVQLPAIEVLGRKHRAAKTASTTDHNLVARFGGSGPALFFIAHYDSVPSSPGAADNAAAVGILLELAREFTEEKPAQAVVLAFTAAEENGLVGAEALAAQRGHEAKFVVALDLIGGDGTLTLNGASRLIGSAELQWIAEAADRAGVALSAPLPHRVISRAWPQAERSDHGPFTLRGIRAIHFYNRGNDGELIDRAYHSAADLPARLHKGALDETARLLRAMASLPMREGDADGFWVPFATNAVIPRWLVYAVCFVMGLGTIAGLSLGKDGILAYRHREEARARGPGVLVALLCYAGGIGAAFAAELALSGSHPAPWLHEPARALAASAGIIAGVGGLIALGIGRFFPFAGDLRYRLVGAIIPLAIGSALLAVDAAELAWIWLLPAACVALAPAPIAALSTLVPAALVLYPAQLREAAWNGFLPPVPLSVLLGVLALPTAATVGLVACRFRSERRWVFGVLVGVALLALAGGIALSVLTQPACSVEQFASRHLACELPAR